METPAIILAFANQKDSYLEKLKQERKSIEMALREADQKGLIKLQSEAQTDLDDIFQLFDAYRGRIKIFHYAGHANGQHLALEDKNAKGEALADLFREENQLNGIELVFLNGCATKGQVAQLLEVGIKGVIATSVPIQDERAGKFAEQFYQSLATGASLQEAYHKASAKICAEEMQEKALEYLGKVRYSVALKKMQEPLEFPWALYLQTKEQSLTWKIPEVKSPDSRKTVIQKANKIYNIDKIDKADFS